MKKLFTLIAVLFCAVCVNAENYQLDLSNLGSGWNSEYDAETKTITYTEAYGGKGWWLESDGKSADFSSYTKVVIETEPLAGYAKLVVEYASGATSSIGEANKGDTKIVANLDPENSNGVKQIYIQGGFAGTITLKDAYLSQDVVDLSIIWEGSANFGIEWTWEYTLGLSGGSFNNVKSGDYIEFEYTINGEADYHQIKALYGQWGNEKHDMIAAMKEVVNEYDCVAVENETTSIAFKLTDDDIATLKSQGLRISGYDITLTKVRSTSTPTGISNVLAPKAENNVRYNFAGQRVGNGAKMYIMNGKKYMK